MVYNDAVLCNTRNKMIQNIIKYDFGGLVKLIFIKILSFFKSNDNYVNFPKKNADDKMKTHSAEKGYKSIQAFKTLSTITKIKYYNINHHRNTKRCTKVNIRLEKMKLISRDKHNNQFIQLLKPISFRRTELC